MKATGIACVFGLFFGLASPLWAAESATPAGRPNILVIMSDEHNAGVMGCYGNKIVQTPNLDRLAQRGVVFENAYTNSPLCVPARLAFTTGKYISRCGGWNNDVRLSSDEYPSIARIMNAAGYESFLCGKMHYDAKHRYGFTEIGGNMNSSVKTGRGGRRAADDLAVSKNKKGESARFSDFRTGDESSVMKHDLKVTQGAVKFLSERRKEDKPFFLFVGYLAPHFPLIVPEKYWQTYKDRVPMPEMPPGTLESLPLNYQHLRVGFKMTDVPPDIVKKGRELYYGLTQWVDEQAGQVLTTLEKSDFADNTVVIYLTDHGENIGEHGLWWKNCVYESAARIPLVVSWPKRWTGGQRRIGACSIVDVVQTIAELGGAKVPSDWNGDSMCGWLDDSATKWKDLAVSEYYAHHIASGYSMIRQGDYKYVYHTRPDDKHPPQRELYNLKTDPGEFKNLTNDPDQQDRIRRMHAALVKEVGEDPEKTELRCREEVAKGYPDVKQGKKKAGKEDE